MIYHHGWGKRLVPQDLIDDLVRRVRLTLKTHYWLFIPSLLTLKTHKMSACFFFVECFYSILEAWWKARGRKKLVSRTFQDLLRLLCYMLLTWKWSIPESDNRTSKWTPLEKDMSRFLEIIFRYSIHIRNPKWSYDFSKPWLIANDWSNWNHHLLKRWLVSI